MGGKAFQFCARSVVKQRLLLRGLLEVAKDDLSERDRKAVRAMAAYLLRMIRSRKRIVDSEFEQIRNDRLGGE